MKSNQKGFSLVETVIAGSILSLLAGALVGAFLYGQESTSLSGKRNRAVFLAEEGLEIARNIRDSSFSDLVDGTHGLSTSSNEWIFSGASDNRDIFTRSLTISSVDANTKQIISTVNWQQNDQRVGTTTLITYLTNWHRVSGQSQGFVVDISGASIGGRNNRDLLGLTITNSGDIDIVIDKMTVSWDNSNLIEQVRIDGDNVWRHNSEGTPDGRQSSGTELDIVDFDLVVGSGVLDINRIRFDDNMSNSIFTILFTFGDGTTKEVAINLSGSGDTIPPSPVSDLAILNISTSSLDLAWTAPGDDGNLGIATSYDIRYSTSPISEVNWSSAIQVIGEPTPSGAGSNESMSISGLLSGTTYYFAIKTSDEVPNESTISNVPSGTTLSSDPWTNPNKESFVDLSGTEDGNKVHVQGDYAYIVRNGGTPDFAVIDVSDTASPSLVGSMSLSGTPKNIFVSGNYAYIASSLNSQELQVIDVSNPVSPTLVGSYDASGGADAFGIYVLGSTAYLVRDSSNRDELMIIDVSSPTAPTLLGSLNLGADSFEVIVLGNYAYISTASNSQELQVIDISNSASPNLLSSLDLSGGSNALTITGSGNKVLLGRANGEVHIIDISSPSLPGSLGMFDALDNANDLSFSSNDNYVFIASNENSAEFQLIDISSPASPVLLSSLNLSSDLNGIFYDESKDRAFAIGDSNSEELIIIQPDP